MRGLTWKSQGVLESSGGDIDPIGSDPIRPRTSADGLQGLVSAAFAGVSGAAAAGGAKTSAGSSVDPALPAGLDVPEGLGGGGGGSRGEKSEGMVPPPAGGWPEG